jgi:long-chain acyl-CoA synthetase
MKDYRSLPDLFQDTILCSNGYPSMFERSGEAWKAYSWSDWQDLVLHTYALLRQRGVLRGDSVGVMCASSPQWLVLDMAIMSLGAVTVPFFANISLHHLQFQVLDAGVTLMFVNDQSDADLVKSLAPHCDVHVWSVGNLEYSAKDRQLLQESLKKIVPQDVATIVYTSGSTGVSKGVVLTHAHLLSQVKATHERFSLLPEERVVSCLPLAHIFERMVMYFYVSCGVNIYFVNDVQRLGEYLREVKPHGITVVPRILEKIHDGVRENAKDLKGWKGYLMQRALDWAEHAEERKNSVPWIYQKLVYRKICKEMGGKLKYVISGGGALNGDITVFFKHIGISVYQGYGLTETSPVLAVNYPGHNKAGTVGPPFPGVSIRIAADREILSKGPNTMRSYHNNEKETQEMIDAEGWLHTGDLGFMDEEGYLVVTGRKKELCKLSTGKYVSPLLIEQKLQLILLVDQALVIADSYKFVSAILFINRKAFEFFAKDKGLRGLNDEDILQSFDFLACINATIELMNQSLNAWEHVQKYVCILDELTIENGFLTPTMKLRRQEVFKHYRDDIEKMYEK